MPDDKAASAADTNTSAEISALYQRLLDSWNHRNAEDFAALFQDEAYCVGFDGSPMNSRAQIEKELRPIFADHPTAAYVARIRGVNLISPDVALLRAVAGMIPPGKSEIMPERNAIQTLVAARHGGQWRIALFQNTPARFDGRPGMAEALTIELQQLL